MSTKLEHWTRRWPGSTGSTLSDMHTSIGGRSNGTSKDNQEETTVEEADLYRRYHSLIHVQVDYNESR